MNIIAALTKRNIIIFTKTLTKSSLIQRTYFSDRCSSLHGGVFESLEGRHNYIAVVCINEELIYNTPKEHISKENNLLTLVTWSKT